MDSFIKGVSGAALGLAVFFGMYGLFNLADFIGSTKGRLEILEKSTEDMYKLKVEHKELWIQYELDRDVNGKFNKKR